jgi:hypothetical protein
LALGFNVSPAAPIRPDMKKGLPVTVAAAVALRIAAPADAHYAQPPIDPVTSSVYGCRGIDFAPGSDYGAGEIEAGNLSCHTARRLVRRVSLRDRGSSHWSCQHRGRQHGDHYSGIAHTDYRCRSGRRFVTWVVT